MRYFYRALSPFDKLRMRVRVWPSPFLAMTLILSLSKDEGRLGAKR